MAFLNFDFKLHAKIKPIITRHFKYTISAEIVVSDGINSHAEIHDLYTGESFVDSWDVSKEIVTDAAAACGSALETLRSNNPGKSYAVESYFAWSKDPYVSVLTDRSNKVKAWSTETETEVAEISTKWIMGPQIDSSVYDAQENALVVNSIPLKELIMKNAETALPDQFDILELEAVGDNPLVQMELAENLIAYGIEGHLDNHITFDIDNTVYVTQGATTTALAAVIADGNLGTREELVRWNVADPSIAEVIACENGILTIKGLTEGKTEISIIYKDTYSSPLEVSVLPRKAKIDITKDKEKSFMGDSTELHVRVSYDNGDAFDVRDTFLSIVSGGEADIEKVDSTTYKIKPGSGDVIELSLVAMSQANDTVTATVMLPVWKKQMDKFGVYPKTSSIIKGQEITLKAFYQKLYDEMDVADSSIAWEILEGADIAELTQATGKRVKVKALSQGAVLIKASLHGSVDTMELTIGGENQPYLQLSESQITIQPKQTKTIYAQMINAEQQPVKWNVVDNGIIRVLSQNDRTIQVEGILNGVATIEAYTSDLSSMGVIEVSEVITMLAAAPDKPGDSDISDIVTYYPEEDGQEQWENDGVVIPPVSGGGFSTLLYGQGRAVADKTKAFKSGIGDNDDLLVKKPEKENVVQSFKYSARLRGKKKHEILIYPEIKFQYSIQYKGDLLITYNESPYKFEVDAYPGKKFEFTVKEDRKVESERDYEIRMKIGGSVEQKTLEYAVNWEASRPVENKGDIKELFTTSKGDYVGPGSPSEWYVDGNKVKETLNRSQFSGVIANEYYDMGDFEAEFNFKPLYATVNVDAQHKGEDDDIVGIIFRAQDENNFYCMLWEAEERVTESRRAGELDGFDIWNKDEWIKPKFTVNPDDYPKEQWNQYCIGMGWKTQHRRIYKVENGKMKRVSAKELSGGNGWYFNYKGEPGDNIAGMKVRCVGKTTEIFVRHHSNKEFTKVFELETDYKTGAFGVCNISQAIEFHQISLKTWKKVTGRVPESGWDTYNGVGAKQLAASGAAYVDAAVKAKLPAGSTYVVSSVTPEVKSTASGKLQAAVDKPVTVETYNAPNAGQTIETEFIKKGKVKVTPDNIDLNTAVNAFEASDLFKQEIAKFKKDHPELQDIEPAYSLVVPGTADPDFLYKDRHLYLWNSKPKIETTNKDFAFTVFAYEGWKKAADLSQFQGGKWATFEIIPRMNSGTVNPKYDTIGWNSTSDKTTTNDKDAVWVKTTEWYHAIFPADIKNEGKVTSDNKLFIEIPPAHEHYIEPYTKEPMPGIYDTIHFLLDKAAVGKSHVWMYFESLPGITTRNAKQKSLINIINNKPIIKTDKPSDKIVVVCDEDPRYEPWTSGKYIGYGKVNGKRPFFADNAGKADMVGVPTDVVYLPPNLKNIQGPFIETDDERVKFYYDKFTKKASFFSDFKDAYIWYTDWYTDWQFDDRHFHADRESITSINDALQIDPTTSPDYDHNVTIEKVEVSSNNSFVAVWPESVTGVYNGLIGNYYRMGRDADVLKEGFKAAGDFKIKRQVFTVNDPLEARQTDGTPGTIVLYPGHTPIKGSVMAKEYKEAHSVIVPAGTPDLSIAVNYLVGTGNDFPDMNVIAPNGDKFGIRWDNGTWSKMPITLSSKFLSTAEYSFSGEKQGWEKMSFKSPLAGTWKVEIFNAGAAQTSYQITTSLGKDLQKSVTLDYLPDPWSLKGYVNDTLSTEFKLEGKTIKYPDSVGTTDLIRIEYTAGGVKVAALPMQSEFALYDSQPLTIIEVRQGEELVPNDPSNGYTLAGNTFKLNGSYLKPGNVILTYSIGTVDHTYVLKKPIGEGAIVHVNGVQLSSSQFSLTGQTLNIQAGLLNLHDWIHVQSYFVKAEFDSTKQNYMGAFQFERIDPRIDFNWGTQSPFVNANEQNFMAIKEVIADKATFVYDLEAEVMYPSSEKVDISNFTNEWVEWNENLLSKGAWVGPPAAPEVTNQNNQGARSGWYNPKHQDFTDYHFSFNVQPREEPSNPQWFVDDDTYGAIFRFDPNTYNFYSYEWDGGGMSIKGMAIYRNICLNLAEFKAGTAQALQYEKTELVKLGEPWTAGAFQAYEIKVRVVSNSITVYVDDVEKLSVVDTDSKALMKGAWGPMTQSMPSTYFWNFEIVKLQKKSIRHNGHNHDVTRPASDTDRLQDVLVHNVNMSAEFQQDITAFLGSLSGVTAADISVEYFIRSNNSLYNIYFDKSNAWNTMDETSTVHAKVMTIPLTSPEAPRYSDYSEITPGYLGTDSPTDVYIPERPEPYVEQLIIPPDDTPNDGFAVAWRGFIYAPVTGDYKFTVTRDDGFRLNIDGKKIIEKWQIGSGVEDSGYASLQGGKWYPISATYFENDGAAMVKLKWTIPGADSEAVVPEECLTPYVGYQVLAKVREATPLPWSPMIHNGYYYFNHEEHYLYANKVHHVVTPVNNAIIVSPRPQQAAPMIVRDNEGNILRKVAFFDESGHLTLENAEQFSGNGYAKYFLAYKDIDGMTLSVKLNGELLTPNNYTFDQKKSSIEFMKNLGFDDIIEVRYCLLYSYHVDYNYNITEDQAKIVLHGSYKLDRMIDMEVIYEGHFTSPFYRTDEVSFNPLLNHNHRGFLYITDKLDDSVKSADINVSPQTLPANGVSNAVITGTVLDKYNNPIQRKDVTIYRDGAVVYRGKTNRAGEVYFYDKPVPNPDMISRYEIWCDDLSNVALLNFYKPDIEDRFFVQMKTTKAAIVAGQADEATVTMTLRDQNWKSVENKELKVAYVDTNDQLREQSLITNAFGQATLKLSGMNEKQGKLLVTAKYDMGSEYASNFIFLKVIGG